MNTPGDVVVIDAVRSPIGRKKGQLADIHPADLLGQVLRGLFERSGVDPSVVKQSFCGCVTAVGEQSYNVGRTGWLVAGLPAATPSTTVDSQCGSSQQAANIATGMVAAGVIDVAVACGVESMTRVPIGVNTSNGPGRAIPKSYFKLHEFTSQFVAAERIASQWDITREDCDRFGARSQQLAANAIAEGRLSREIVPITVRTEDGSDLIVDTDGCPRDTTLAGLAALKPVVGDDGVHTAGTSSQIADGAAAMLIMSAQRAHELGLEPRARITHQCLVGVDPAANLTGPIDATRVMLDMSGMKMSDIELVEINEAFASVPLAWERELGADLEVTNVNGGAIALGHPLGATGVRLLTSAVYEMERSDRSNALVTMCCGGGLGTGTILERV